MSSRTCKYALDEIAFSWGQHAIEMEPSCRRISEPRAHTITSRHCLVPKFCTLGKIARCAPIKSAATFVTNRFSVFWVLARLSESNKPKAIAGQIRRAIWFVGFRPLQYSKFWELTAHFWVLELLVGPECLPWAKRNHRRSRSSLTSGRILQAITSL